MAHRPIHQLEALLRHWEDYCLLQKAALVPFERLGRTPPIPISGGLKNWSELRTDILQRNVYSVEKYGLPEGLIDALGLFSTIPFYIWAWNYWSRRVFRITRELEALLFATSVKNLTYGDIALPFPSFAVELEKPITSDGREFDLILVSSGSELHPLVTDKLLSITPISARAEEHPALNAMDRRKLLDLQAKGRWNDVAKLHQRLRDPFQRAYGMGGLVADLSRHGGEYVTSSLPVIFGEFTEPRAEKTGNNDHQGYDEFMMRVIHLVVGLCCYLRSLPPVSPHRSDWTSLSKSSLLDPRAITNKALICTVQSTRKISIPDIELIEGSKYSDDRDDDDAEHPHRELCAHFRRGHWRRRPGSGNDPNAPKVVPVAFTIVRRDRLAPGAIPGGQQTNL